MYHFRVTRRYDQKRRARQQGETRQRIVEAAVALHQQKGVAATTMTDIAERADVGRMTLYRHFPDETALVNGCVGHYFAQHVLPDPAVWAAIADPCERLKVGLRASYAYHRSTQAMMARNLAAMRDHPVLEPYNAVWRQAVQVLAEPFAGAGMSASDLHAALALALSFDTWRLLAQDHGLDDGQAADLLVHLICR